MSLYIASTQKYPLQVANYEYLATVHCMKKMGSENLLGRDLEVLESIRKHLLDDPDISESFPTIVPANNPVCEWDTYLAEEISSEKTSFSLDNKSKNDVDGGSDHLKQHVGVKKRARHYAVEMKRPTKNGPTMWLVACGLWLHKCKTSDASLAYHGTTVRFHGSSGTK